MVQYLLSVTALLICTVTDLRFKKISRAVAVVYFVLLLAAHLLSACFGQSAESAFTGLPAGELSAESPSDGIPPDGGLLKANLLSCLLFIACGAIPGLLALLLAKLTREAIGYGDGVLILLLGCSLGFWNCLSVLLLAFLLAGVFGGVLLVIKKGTGKTRIAFVPFLLLGVLLQGLLQYMP